MTNLENVIKVCKFLYQSNINTQLTEILDKRLSKPIQDKFDFGYYPDNNNLSLLYNLINKQDLIDLKLLYSYKIYDSLFPRNNDFSYFNDYEMVMPFKDQYGDVIGIVGRTLLSEKERKEKKIAKYKNTKFTKNKYLYGLFENKEHITKSAFTYIVEGQFDVIKAHEYGIKNIVALGSANMSFRQVSLIKRYSNMLVLLLDNDDAGIKGREKIIKKYSQYINIKNAFIPLKYKDLDEYLCSKPKSLNIGYDL